MQENKRQGPRGKIFCLLWLEALETGQKDEGCCGEGRRKERLKARGGGKGEEGEGRLTSR